MSRIMIIHPEGNLNNNPNLTGIVEILCEKGHKVDIYSPRLGHMGQCAPCQGARFILAENTVGVITVLPAESFKTTEALSDYISREIPGYDLVIGVDRGIIEASIIARQRKVPYGLISYEILFSDETGEEYLIADKEASQGVAFAVCQDRVRSYHLSKENGIPLERIINIPVAGRMAKRHVPSSILHEKLGIAPQTKIALYIGGITYKWAGIDELIACSDRWPDDWVLVLHQRYSLYDKEFLSRLSKKKKRNIHLSPFPNLPFDQLHILLNAADLGLSFYIPQFAGQGLSDRNNLKYIGMASGKTSTYLQHGLPIMTNEIGEMSEYVRNYKLGSVVADFSGIGHVLESIDNNELSAFNNNCYEFFNSHLDLDATIQPFLDIISNLPGGGTNRDAAPLDREPLTSWSNFMDDFRVGATELDESKQENLSLQPLCSYRQPPAGTTEQFIAVQPQQVMGHTSSAWQSVKTYEIPPFGHGLPAIERIIAHIVTTKLGGNPRIPGDFWNRVIAVKVQCDLRRPSGQQFAPGLATLGDIDPAFLAAEGPQREADIKRYAELLGQGHDLGAALYITGEALNISGGGAAPPESIFMVDGARRISASVLAGKRAIEIVILMTEDEYAAHTRPGTALKLQQEIKSLSWFNQYQSIPLVGIRGERSLNRFGLMDMSLLRDASVMDFGCNLGQASIKATMAGASEVWGVEGMPDTFQIASRIAMVARFSNLHYCNVNFNDPDFDTQIDAHVPGKVDYSFFFSVYRTKELTQRDRLFQYIIDKTIKGIFFEGHADPKIDSLEYYGWLFESFGLTARYLGNSEGELRPLFFIALEGHQKNVAPQIPYPVVQPTRSSRYLVSAIVSTYKSERFIEERLQDLLAQTLGDLLEIVVVDSGSPENEGEIVRRYAALHANITYIRTTERETVYQAWNRGILASSGKYITNANTDDRLRPDALEIMAAELDAHPDIALVYSDFFITGCENMPFPEHIRTGYSLKPDYHPSIMLHGCHMGPQPVWRRSLHDEMGLFDESFKSAGDYEFWCRIACRHPMKHIPEFLGLYLHNPSGIANSDTSGAHSETQQVREMYRTLLPPPRQDLPTGFYFREAVEPGHYVNIGMITYNRLEFTRQSVEALLRCTDFPYVLTVIDNASDDGTRQFLQEQKQRGIIKNLVLLDENVGVAKASNLAWSLEPQADYYLKLDNDIVVQKPGWLEAMVTVADRVPNAGAVAYNFEPESYPLVTLNGISVREKLEGNLGGACILIPRRTHDRLGFWCEDYGLYGEEDHDYGFRIRLAGLRNLYLADEEVGFHLPAGRAAQIDDQTFVACDGMEEEMHPEYRRWKDALRRDNLASGRVRNNLVAYCNDPARLLVPSPFSSEFLKAKPSPLGSPEPLKVAVFSVDSLEQACGHYRIRAPFGVRSEFQELSGVEVVDGGYKPNSEALRQADVLLVQRFFPQPASRTILEYLLTLGKPLVYEVDDLLTELPQSNPHHDFGAACAPLIHDFARRCTAITVSTASLKERFAPDNANVFVLPNLLDAEIWSRTSPPSQGSLVIGFAATVTHQRDIEELAQVLEMLAVKHPGKLAFTFMGCASERLSRLPGFCALPFEESYRAYAARLQETPCDIMLVPLEDTPFNRCKSNVKWLEYSACGIAGVYADLPPYNDCVQHGKTGLLAGPSPRQWFEAIDLLIEHPSLRCDIARAARQEVLSAYTLKAQGHRFRDAYRTIMAHQKPPAVSIVIPLFNKVELTRHCLEHLAKNTDQALFELILVDNGSSDGTAAYLKTLPPSVKLVQNTVNQGFAKACNQGAALAKGRYLLFLNNDTEPLPGWLEPLLAVLDSDPEVAAAGSKLLFPNGSIQHAGVILAKDHTSDDPLVALHIYYQKPAAHPEANVPTCYQALTAACLAVRREAFAAVDGFDEGYWNGYEDVDLCFKLTGSGAKLVYQPESVLIHFESQSGSERFTKVNDNVRRLHKKWLGKVPLDLEIAADGTLTKGPGLHGPYRPGRTSQSPHKVSIVIPVFNQASYTKQCLEALFAVTGREIPYEVIVVDNASSDWTHEYLTGLVPRIRVLSNDRNLGFAKACNQGAQAALGRFLVFLNNDTLPKPGWLEALVKEAESGGADLVGAKLLYPDGTVQHAGVGFAAPGDGVHVFKGMPGDHPAANRKRFMQCVTGACLLLERQLFLELGCFDEGFVNGYEDVDLCLRAQAAGKTVLYAPESVLVHFEETSAGRKEKDRHNAERFFARWGGRIRFDNSDIYEAEGLLRPIGEEQADRLWALLGANDNAVFIYLNVLSRYPQDAGALLNLGRACAANGRSADARVFLDRLLEFRPGQPCALRELARLGSAGGA